MSDFINQMLQETLDESNDSNLSEFSYIEHADLHLEAKFLKDRKCYQLDFAGLSVQVPQNWGPFKNRISKEFILNSSNDPELFLTVLSTHLKQQINCLKISILGSTSVKTDSKAAA